MFNTIECEGKDVDDAIKNALKELNSKREDVEVQIVQIEEKGMLGIFGKKKALVKVTPKYNDTQLAVKATEKLVNLIGVETEPGDVVEVVKEGEKIYLNIRSTSGRLIGRRGITLAALEYLVNRFVSQEKEDARKIELDVDNYRKRRERTLIAIAKRAARKSFHTGREIELEPMNPPDRRLIHTILKSDDRVRTMSKGEGKYRRVIIIPKKDGRRNPRDKYSNSPRSRRSQKQDKSEYSSHYDNASETEELLKQVQNEETEIACAKTIKIDDDFNDSAAKDEFLDDLDDSDFDELEAIDDESTEP